MTDLIKLALDSGFTSAARFDPEKISFHNAHILRDVCKGNSCTFYGRYWTCPPAVGSVENCIAKVRNYHSGLGVQFVIDAVSYQSNEALFNAIRDTFNDMTRELLTNLRKELGEVLALGMSGCTLCAHCTYPKGSCAHPDKMILCISSHGIDVFELCELCGFVHAGSDKTEFFGLFLFNESKNV